MRRSSPRPPAICTTAMTSCANGCATSWPTSARTAPCRMWCPIPHAATRGQVPGFFGSTGWGDAICVVPWTLWLHYGDRDVARGDAAGHGALGRLRLVDQRRADRPAAARLGRARLHLRRLAAAQGAERKAAATIGDDAAATIYLYISSTLTAKAARIVGDEALAQAHERTRGSRRRRPSPTSSSRRRAVCVYDDQTSYALAILHDLIPPELLPAASRLLQGDHRPRRRPHRHRLHRHARASAGAC